MEKIMELVIFVLFAAMMTLIAVKVR